MKTVLITGANKGIGFETTAEQGAVPIVELAIQSHPALLQNF